VVYVSHSAGELPECINQRLEFIPREGGFDLACSDQVSAGPAPAAPRRR
jgi:hypothetical protein